MNHIGVTKFIVIDGLKVKIKEDIKQYNKIQQEVIIIFEINLEIQIQKFTWEFYKKIHATYDKIPPSLKGGMMVDDEDRMTLI